MSLVSWESFFSDAELWERCATVRYLQSEVSTRAVSTLRCLVSVEDVEDQCPYCASKDIKSEGSDNICCQDCRWIVGSKRRNSGTSDDADSLVCVSDPSTEGPFGHFLAYSSSSGPSGPSNHQTLPGGESKLARRPSLNPPRRSAILLLAQSVCHAFRNAPLPTEVSLPTAPSPATITRIATTLQAAVTAKGAPVTAAAAHARGACPSASSSHNQLVSPASLTVTFMNGVLAAIGLAAIPPPHLLAQIMTTTQKVVGQVPSSKRGRLPAVLEAVAGVVMVAHVGACLQRLNGARCGAGGCDAMRCNPYSHVALFSHAPTGSPSGPSVETPGGQGGARPKSPSTLTTKHLDTLSAMDSVAEGGGMVKGTMEGCVAAVVAATINPPSPHGSDCGAGAELADLLGASNVSDVDDDFARSDDGGDSDGGRPSDGVDVVDGDRNPRTQRSVSVVSGSSAASFVSIDSRTSRTSSVSGLSGADMRSITVGSSVHASRQASALSLSEARQSSDRGPGRGSRLGSAAIRGSARSIAASTRRATASSPRARTLSAHLSGGVPSNRQRQNSIASSTRSGTSRTSAPRRRTRSKPLASPVAAAPSAAPLENRVELLPTMSAVALALLPPELLSHAVGGVTGASGSLPNPLSSPLGVSPTCSGPSGSAPAALTLSRDRGGAGVLPARSPVSPVGAFSTVGTSPERPTDASRLPEMPAGSPTRTTASSAGAPWLLTPSQSISAPPGGCVDGVMGSSVDRALQLSMLVDALRSIISANDSVLDKRPLCEEHKKEYASWVKDAVVDSAGVAHGPRGVRVSVLKVPPGGVLRSLLWPEGVVGCPAPTLTPPSATGAPSGAAAFATLMNSSLGGGSARAFGAAAPRAPMRPGTQSNGGAGAGGARGARGGVVATRASPSPRGADVSTGLSLPPISSGSMRAA